jgi:UDP-glucose 4-epimerase
MKVVITGATGNIGTSVIRSLEHDTHVEEVVGIARRRPALHPRKTRFVEVDVRTDDLDLCMRGAQAVVHLAWQLQPARRPERLHRINIDGTRRVLQASARAGVGALIVASSVGAYSEGPKDHRVDERWPTGGIPTSLYSRQKVTVERMLDHFEADHPEVRLVRMRPALVFKRDAASEIKRLFLGPFVPSALLRHDRIPLVPELPRLRFQAVHSHDVGEAVRRMLLSDAHGAYNLAAEPVLDSAELARAFHARRVPVSPAVLRGGVQAAYWLHLTPSHRGWVDLALGVPLMSSERAERELGWHPQHGATQALVELVDGMHDRAGMPTAPLAPA